MLWRNKFFSYYWLSFFLSSCGNKQKKQETQQEETAPKQDAAADEEQDIWNQLMGSIAKIDSYDGDRILESGQGFFVDEDLLVTKYSLVNQATNVKVQPFDEAKKYTARSFVAFDRIKRPDHFESGQHQPRTH